MRLLYRPHKTVICSAIIQVRLNWQKNLVFHARSKHIEISHHFVRECVLNGEINLEYVPTNDQPVDILIKPLGRNKFERHRDNIGIISRPSRYRMRFFLFISLHFPSRRMGIGTCSIYHYSSSSSSNTSLTAQYTRPCAALFPCLRVNCCTKSSASICEPKDCTCFVSTVPHNLSITFFWA